MKWWDQMPWSSFLNVELQPTFSLSTFTFIKRLLSSSSLSAIRVVSFAYLRLLILPTDLKTEQGVRWNSLLISSPGLAPADKHAHFLKSKLVCVVTLRLIIRASTYWKRTGDAFASGPYYVPGGVPRPLHMLTYYRNNSKGGSILQFNSVTLSCLTLCYPMDCQASLSITNSCSLLKLMSIELVMPSNHLILCLPLLLSIFPSIWVFSNESILCSRWPK